MINVDLQGRLGNQLFIYAMARKLQILMEEEQKKEQKVYVNTYMTEVYNWKNSLVNYNINKNFIFYNTPLRRFKCQTPFIQNLIRVLYRKFTYKKNSQEIYKIDKQLKKFFEAFGMYICRDGYLDFNIDPKKKNVVLYGYYQCEKYFNDIREVLLKEFTPKNDVLEKNISLIKDIEESNSVCVTMRLGGDFVNNPIYNVCNIEYYKRGMQYIAEKIKNPKFFIFADEPEWVKKNVKFDYDVVFEEGNDPDYEKLRVMSKCKNFVIANSSFSWWVQYLSTNENKIVVAPEKWYNDEKMVCDIYMPQWHILKV